jgi:hypothetical protein
MAMSAASIADARVVSAHRMARKSTSNEDQLEHEQRTQERRSVNGRC